jgi:RNA polymerase sigma-70 factor (ECF subfamily)
VNCSIDFIKNNQFKPEDFDTTLYKIEENDTAQ